ncbi:Reticulocyte-binding protein 2-like protein a [Diplonema papillatum]|nr:Reticulocyte-binding protein 2-like protein a [Diplonema papillatum]
MEPLPTEAPVAAHHMDPMDGGSPRPGHEAEESDREPVSKKRATPPAELASPDSPQMHVMSTASAAASPVHVYKYNLDDLLAADAKSYGLLTSPRSKEACRMHGIVPNELYPRMIHTFAASKNELPQVTQRKYEHFERRRMQKLQFLVGERRKLGRAHFDTMAGGVSRRRSPSVELDLETAIDCLTSEERRKIADEIAEAEKKLHRQYAASETQRRRKQLAKEQKAALEAKETERVRLIEEKRRDDEARRLLKIEQAAARAESIRQRKQNLDRTRALRVEEELQDKAEKVISFERERLKQQVERQAAAEAKAQQEVGKLERHRREVEEMLDAGWEKAKLTELSQDNVQTLSERRRREYQERTEDRARKQEAARQRVKQMEEMRKVGIAQKTQDKLDRQEKAFRMQKEQQVLQLTEKSIRHEEAQEAVDRMRRREAYELELKQRDVQRKLDRIAEHEEARWLAQQHKKQRIEALRLQENRPATPRNKHTNAEWVSSTKRSAMT